MASVGVAGSTVVAMPATNQQETNIQRRYKSGCALGLAITQLVIGVLCIIAQVFLFLFLSPLLFVGHGIWTGIIFIITGSFGIASSCSKTKCTVVTFLVMSIISAVFTVGLLTPAAIDWAIAGCSHCDRYYVYYSRISIYPAAIMVFLAVLEAVLAIVSSGVACHAICCGYNQQQTPAVAGQVQYVIGPNGQQQAVIVPLGQQPQGYMPTAPPYRGPAPLPYPYAPQQGHHGYGPPPPK